MMAKGERQFDKTVLNEKRCDRHCNFKTCDIKKN